MAIRRRLSSRRLVVLALLPGLIATISFWVTSNHGSAAVQGQLPQGIAQLPGDIVQVTSEDGRASRPALLETAGGRLIVFYHIDFNVDQEHGLFYRTSDDSGATWSAPSVLMVGSAFSPDLAQAADGTLWLVYTRCCPDERFNVYYRTSADNGATWSEETLFTDEPENEFAPTIVQTVSGRLIVAYDACCSEPDRLWYRTSDDNGSTWSAPPTADR